MIACLQIGNKIVYYHEIHPALYDNELSKGQWQEERRGAKEFTLA